MKLTEFKKLIREEVRKVLSEKNHSQYAWERLNDKQKEKLLSMYVKDPDDIDNMSLEWDSLPDYVLANISRLLVRTPYSELSKLFKKN